MAESSEDVNASLWFLVRQLAARMDRLGDALYREGLGISLAQFLVLSVVDAYPGAINQQAVADRLSLSKGTVSRQIETAVAAGLMTVTVSPSSRRENAVALTPRGTELVRRGDELLATVLERDMPALPAGEVAATVRTLGTLNAAFGGPASFDTFGPPAAPR
jgi:DNA-binding MarR family transcriptional regulator